MFKRIINSKTSNTDDEDSSPGIIKLSNTPKGVITQVHKEPASTTPTADASEEDDEDKESCISRCCNFFFSKRDDYEKEVEPTENFIFLGPQSHYNLGRKTLVLDLDETLVHSSFEGNHDPDILLPVKIQDEIFKIKVMVRPGVEEYLRKMGEVYEVVVFTASLSEYADPLVDILDKTGVVAYRLFREHCTLYNGVYVKDLSRLGRDLKDIIIVDNSPNSFMFQPKNALLIKNFFDDKTDDELDVLTPFFQYMSGIYDVRPTEAWRTKFFAGEAEEFLQVQKSKRSNLGVHQRETEEASIDQEDISPLHTEKSSSNEKLKWERNDFENSGGMELDSVKTMINPKFINKGDSSKRSTNYSKVSQGKKLNKSNNHIRASDLFSPKTESDDVPPFNPNRSFVSPDKNRNSSSRNSQRICVTEHLSDSISPYELEQIKQLEISNDEEVEDLTQHEKRRALNNKALNIQSPVHTSTKKIIYPNSKENQDKKHSKEVALGDYQQIEQNTEKNTNES